MAGKTSYTVQRTAANNTRDFTINGITLTRKVRTAVCGKRTQIAQDITVDFNGASLEAILAAAASQWIVEYQSDRRVHKDAPEREHQAAEVWLTARPQHTLSAVAMLSKRGNEITEDSLAALAAKFGLKLVKADSTADSTPTA